MVAYPQPRTVGRPSRSQTSERTAMPLLRWAAALLLAYVLGAFPTGALVARAHGVDLTQYGSRRTGATNALRVLGKPAAALVLGGDALKGALAVGLARRLAGDGAAPAAA